MGTRMICQGCGSQKDDVDPYTGWCEICTLRSHSAELMTIKTSSFIEKHCKKAGISRGDGRLDFRTMETFQASLAAAALEDRGLKLFDREEELRERAIELQTREGELATGATAAPKTGKQAEIDRKKGELASLKGKSAPGAAYALMREIEELEK